MLRSAPSRIGMTARTKDRQLIVVGRWPMVVRQNDPAGGQRRTFRFLPPGARRRCERPTTTGEKRPLAAPSDKLLLSRSVAAKHNPNPNDDRERLVSGAPVGDDSSFELKLRPQRLVEFIGQKKVKENLAVAIEAARSRGEAMDHVLLYGPPGLARRRSPTSSPTNSACISSRPPRRCCRSRAI